MPALLLHMTLAKQALERSDAPSLLRQAAARRRDVLLLGSIFPDLPYHGRFAQQLLRHLAGREYRLSEWGDLFHTRGTGRLALGFLRYLVRSHLAPAPRDAVLALVAGYLCHHAVDRVVHPAINQLVDRHLGEQDAPHVVLHERIERYQSLFYHHDLLGYDILCTPFARDLVREVAGSGLVRPMLEPTLWRAVRAACLETHGRAPEPARMSDWLWGTTVYGLLMSSPIARREQVKGEVARVRETLYQGPGVDMVLPLARALEATLSSWRAAAALLEADQVTGEVQRVFLGAVPDVDLGTGS